MKHVPYHNLERSGDDGQTDLNSTLRVDKDSPRIEILGELDELNSWLGVLIAHSSLRKTQEILGFIQHDLSDLIEQMSIPESSLFSAKYIDRIDATLTDLKPTLEGPLDDVLPGGSSVASLTHVARSVCRRAERRMVSLFSIDPLPHVERCIVYLNRLSDLLYSVARIENRHSDTSDTRWKRELSLFSRD